MKKKLLIYTDATTGPATLAELKALAPLNKEFELTWAYAPQSPLAQEAASLSFSSQPLNLGLAAQSPSWLARPIATLRRLSGVDKSRQELIAASLKPMKADLLWIYSEADEGREACRRLAAAARAAGIGQIFLRFLQPSHRPQDAAQMQADQVLLQEVDQWVAVSAFAGRRLMDYRGVKPGRWAALPPCLPEQDQRVRADGAALRSAWGVLDEELLVGALEPGPAALWLIGALALVKSPLRLALLGGAGERRLWSDEVRRLDLGKRVILPDEWGGPAQAVAAFDLLALPQPSEAWQVPMEAMLLGRPVLASSTGGMEEWVEPGVSGRLLLPKDREAWAAALEELCRDRRLREGMGLSGKERFFRLFDQDRFAGRVGALLKERGL
ncbi:MAG: glycosyltransferase family 4 protein [bacterium]|nr:glycosyltransferase family 4 protein [bacterium]